jgi:hypothetical protein
MEFIFFILLAFSTTVSWFRFYPRNTSEERNTAILLLAVMLVFVFFYSSSINLLGYLIMNTEEWKKNYLTTYGLLPAWLHASHFILHVVGGLAVIIFTLTLARYRNTARIWLMRVIPVVAFTQGIAFYKGYSRVHGIEETQNTVLLFVMLSLLLHAALFLFLDSVRVRKYFKAI